MEHTLPPLPYPHDALAPHMSRETLEYHHDKHHKAYADNYNAAVKGTDWDSHPVEDVLRRLSHVPESIRAAVRNHGGGAANHALFWLVMAPKPAPPSLALIKAFNDSFGSVDSFKQQFGDARSGGLRPAIPLREGRGATPRNSTPMAG